jgi:sialate O-acetylesterase
VRDFSAVAYFFGRELHRELNVPIGLICASWGGTVAEAWTSEKTLRDMGDFDEALDALEQERQNPGYLKEKHDQATQRWWRALEQADPGSGAGQWMSPGCDDSGWKVMSVPTAWESEDLRDFDGVVWLRTEIELPETWVGRQLVLELGPIDDIDTTWVNGTKVGGLEQPNRWHVSRKHAVPADVAKAGRNTIAVRVCDMGRRGGIYGKPEQLKLYPADASNAARSLAGEWRYQVGIELTKLPPWPQTYLLHANSPSVLYNGMITPLVPYTIRGAIWYQGESNRLRAQQYRTLFPRMIGNWRAAWGQGDFPFYYVQIAPFDYARDTGQTGELREAQLMTLATKNTGMVVTMDIGNLRDIHPKNKQDVGRRLSLWALARTYGRTGLMYSGPLYKSTSVESSRIRVHFDHVGGGLATRDGKPLTWFEIAGEDRKFAEARAEIDGDTVVVWSEAVPEPVAVRFGWQTVAEPNLMNKEGLPASPFRTHDWAEEPPPE